MEICNELPLNITRGRKPEMDYSLFSETGIVVKFADTVEEKVRSKINNVGTQAKSLGYPVRTYMIKKDSVYVGCVTRK
jgi:hypothetical protein